MSEYFFKLCWKNLWRNSRRTLLTVNAIGVGVMALLFLHNYYDAFHEQVVDNAIRYHSGHLQVSHPEFPEEKNPQKFMRESGAVTGWLSRHPSVTHFSSYVLLQGLISSPRGSANVIFKGVDPAKEKTTSGFAKSIVEGRFLSPKDSRQILLGRKLQRLLKVRLGDKVVVLTQGIDGSIGNEMFQVAGIFDTQSEMDKSLAFIRIAEARQLLSLPPDAVHQISVLLNGAEEIAPVQRQFLADFRGKPLGILAWHQLQRHLVAMIELNRAVNRILMAIILIIAALGIVNSILMGILERTKEFGVMMAIGTTRTEVIGMVVTETFLMGAVGVLVGNILGVMLTLYFNRVGFDLSWLTDQRLVINGTIIDTVSYPTVNWRHSGFITSAILLVSILIAIVPVRHIARLNPIKALRA